MYLSCPLNFQSSPLMRCRHCHFPRGFGETILENLLLDLLNFFAVLVVSHWVCCLKCRRHNVMINEEENFAATHPQEQEILRDEILVAVDPLSAAASSAIGPPSAVAAAPDASIGRSCSAAAYQTISKAALGKLNYLRACLVRKLYSHATFPSFCLPERRLEMEICVFSML
jgi:hypothetical protein